MHSRVKMSSTGRGDGAREGGGWVESMSWAWIWGRGKVMFQSKNQYGMPRMGVCSLEVSWTVRRQGEEGESEGGG